MAGAYNHVVSHWLLHIPFLAYCIYSCNSFYYSLDWFMVCPEIADNVMVERRVAAVRTYAAKSL